MLPTTAESGRTRRRAAPGPRGELDQFYTRPAAAAACFEDLGRLLAELDLSGEPLFVEPSAGAGAFFRLLPPDRRVGLDLDPRYPGVETQDFFTWTPALPVEKRRVVVLGNPPFGKRGRTAIQFLLQAATHADTIAFIVPVNFRKYSIHRQVPPGFRWIFARALPPDSFQLADGTEYCVNTEFQVWTRRQSTHPDRRLSHPAPIRHPDFVMWQYNNTRQALRVFANDFDFAVPCQGWQDYSRRESDADACEKHKQWMLLKPRTPLARKRLFEQIDHGELARRTATSVPGFRKCDLVLKYLGRFESDSTAAFLKF